MAFCVAISMVIAVTRYCDFLPCGAIQAYVLFPLSFFTLALLLYQRNIWRCVDTWFLATTFVWAVISLGLNSNRIAQPFLSGDYQNLCIMFFICYPFAKAVDAQQRKLAFTLLAVLSVLLISVACWYLMYCVAFDAFPLHAPFQSEYLPQIGDDGRLYSLIHPNGTALICLIAAQLCIYLMLRTKHKALCILEAVALIGIVGVIAATDCRTAYLILSICTGMLAYLVLVRRKNWKSALMRQTVSFLCAFLACVLCFFCIKAVKSGVGSLYAAAQARTADAVIASSTMEQPTSTTTPVKTSAAASVTTPTTASVTASVSPTDAVPAQQEAVAATPAPVAKLAERSLSGDILTLNGRTRIWSSILSALADRPDILLRGTTSYHAIQALENDFPPGSPHNFHNSFLSILICYGVMGFVTYVAFVICMLVCAIRVFFAKPEHVELSSAFLMTLMVSGFLVGMLESILFTDGQPQFIEVWFLLAGGLAVEISRELRHKRV